jgi:CBS domain-containing protein
MRVKELMSAPAATVAPGDSLHVADGIMSLGGVRHLAVVSDGELRGVVSQRDILRAPGLLSPVLSSPRAVLRALSVEDLMSTEVVTVRAQASVEEAAERLLRYRIGCLPVIGEQGELVGIVTTSDLLRAIAGSMAAVDAGASAQARRSPVTQAQA